MRDKSKYERGYRDPGSLVALGLEGRQTALPLALAIALGPPRSSPRRREAALSLRLVEPPARPAHTRRNQ